MAVLPGEPGLAGFIAAKDDGSGGDNWSYKTWKAPVKSSPPTNKHPTFCRPDAFQSTEGNLLIVVHRASKNTPLSSSIVGPGLVSSLEAQAAKWAHMPIPIKARHYGRTL